MTAKGGVGTMTLSYSFLFHCFVYMTLMIKLSTEWDPYSRETVLSNKLPNTFLKGSRRRVAKSFINTQGSTALTVKLIRTQTKTEKAKRNAG